MRHNSCCWKDLHQTCTQYSYPSLKGLSEHLFKAVTIMNLHYAWRVVSFSLVFLFFFHPIVFPQQHLQHCSPFSYLSFFVFAGDPNVQTLHGLHALYINAGSDPFQVITDAVRWVSSPFYSSIQCFDTFSANCKGWLDWQWICLGCVSAVESHLGTFVHRDKKKVGGLLLQLWSSLFCCDCCSPSHPK